MAEYLSFCHAKQAGLSLSATSKAKRLSAYDALHYGHPRITTFSPPDIFFPLQLVDPEQFGLVPKVAIDMPSGWDVDTGMPTQPTAQEMEEGASRIPVIVPEVLISLGAPKMGTLQYPGMHYLAMRNLPFQLKEKYGLNTPSYAGTKSYTMLSKLSSEKIAEMQASAAAQEAADAAAATAAAAAAAPAAAGVCEHHTHSVC